MSKNGTKEVVVWSKNPKYQSRNTDMNLVSPCQYTYKTNKTKTKLKQKTETTIINPNPINYECIN